MSREIGGPPSFQRRVKMHRAWDYWVVFCWENPYFWVPLLAGLCVGSLAAWWQ